jgi:hypothetical protein
MQRDGWFIRHPSGCRILRKCDGLCDKKIPFQSGESMSRKIREYRRWNNLSPTLRINHAMSPPAVAENALHVTSEDVLYLGVSESGREQCLGQLGHL